MLPATRLDRQGQQAPELARAALRLATAIFLYVPRNRVWRRHGFGKVSRFSIGPVAVQPAAGQPIKQGSGQAASQSIERD